MIIDRTEELHDAAAKTWQAVQDKQTATAMVIGPITVHTHWCVDHNQFECIVVTDEPYGFTIVDNQDDIELLYKALALMGVLVSNLVSRMADEMMLEIPPRKVSTI